MTETKTTLPKRLWDFEPAVIRGFLVSLAAFLALFGFEWATEENAITAFNVIASLLPILAGIFVRSAVTPVAKTAAVEGDHGDFVAEGEASPYPEGTPVDILPEDENPGSPRFGNDPYREEF